MSAIDETTRGQAPTASTRATLGEVARVMRAAGADAVVILDADEQPVGLITERELVDAVAASRHPDHGTAAMWMRTDVVAVPAAAPAPTRRRRLPATDAGALVSRRERTRARS